MTTMLKPKNPNFYTIYTATYFNQANQVGDYIIASGYVTFFMSKGFVGYYWRPKIRFCCDVDENYFLHL